MRENTVGSRTSFLSGKSVFWAVVFAFSFLFLYAFSSVCFPFAVGFALAYICSPFVNSVSKRVNRTLICAILAAGVVCVFIIAAAELLPRLREYLTLIAQNAHFYFDRFFSFLDNTFSSANFGNYKSEITSLQLELQKYFDQKIYIFASILKKIASNAGTITEFFSFFVVMPISFFYFLRDWNSIATGFYGCVPKRQKNAVFEASTVVRKTLSNFFRGQFYVVAILSAYYSTLLLAIGLRHWIPLGILSGLFSFIPFIGALFSCVLVIFVSVPTLDLTKLYILLAIYIVGQFFEGYVLSPRFVGKRTGLHPLWILFSFFAGIQLGGIVGVLVAIPLTAVACNLARLAADKFRAGQTYKQ
ncbi:MAG: AI-2E family transporter [Holosporaceae bacterium]|jgi:predicted PurR-regulated permease PerM|nr:AI-2E family transporter [Holosporaceae bacterium]